MRWLHSTAAVVLIVTASQRPSHADDSDPGDHLREVHVGITVGLGAAYLIAEFGLNSQLSPTVCDWCAPTRFDISARDALLWRNPHAANVTGNITGYVLAPAAAIGLTYLAAGDATWRHHFDDVVPILQSAIAVSLLQHVTKLVAARQRPAVHFEAVPSTATTEDNVSFWSGHTSLAFSLAVSAGVVTSERGYALAPLVWATGLTLAATTGYLRIAADRHYATDVLVGAAMGSLVGYLWPVLVHPHLRHAMTVTPIERGLALVGTF